MWEAVATTAGASTLAVFAPPWYTKTGLPHNLCSSTMTNKKRGDDSEKDDDNRMLIAGIIIGLLVLILFAVAIVVRISREIP